MDPFGIVQLASLAVFLAIFVAGTVSVWRRTGRCPLRLLGAGFTAGGLVIYALSMRQLGASWRLGIDSHVSDRLVTTGVYAVSRNPIYLFFNLYLLGAFAMHGTPVLLLFVIVMAALLHWQTLIEERALLEAHGAVYTDYCACVPRYLAPLSLFRATWHRMVARVSGPTASSE